MLVDPALPGPTLPTGVNYGTAGLTPCPGACKAPPCHKRGGAEGCALCVGATANIKLAHTPYLRSRHRGGYTRLAGWLESPSARGGL